jgi:photosynthetic reaction center cytochrome c subunit
MNKKTFAIAAIGLSLALSGCEIGPKVTQQNGPRGTGMNQVVDKDLIKPAAYIPPPPYPLEADTGGPRAGQTYQNVKVLGDLSTDEFNRLMPAVITAITLKIWRRMSFIPRVSPAR